MCMLHIHDANDEVNLDILKQSCFHNILRKTVEGYLVCSGSLTVNTM